MKQIMFVQWIIEENNHNLITSKITSEGEFIFAIVGDNDNDNTNIILNY